MKYIIAYTEIIPRLEEIDAISEEQARKKMDKLIEGRNTSESLTGLACDYEIISIMEKDTINKFAVYD